MLSTRKKQAALFNVSNVFGLELDPHTLDAPLAHAGQELVRRTAPGGAVTDAQVCQAFGASPAPGGAPHARAARWKRMSASEHRVTGVVADRRDPAE